MATTSTEIRKAALLAAQPAKALAGSLLLLDAMTSLDTEQRLVRAWICDELERRYPQVDAALDAWAQDAAAERPMSYVEALLAALPAEVLV